jgi:hypothetical protein
MIRLVTVIGHGVELLPHFINHYISQVDEINIVVYESDLYPILFSEVTKITENFDNVSIVKVHRDRIFDWERVTILYNYVTNKKPDDWWVIADIDEFQVYPYLLKKITHDMDMNGHIIARGGFIDRIGEGGQFSELKSDVTLWEQFPNAGFFRYPMSNANPNKVCVKKGYVELTSGQHYAKIDGHTTWRWQGWKHPLINSKNTIQVHHFKWDKTSIERIKLVADNNQEYSYSNEYKLLYQELEKTNFVIDLNNKNFEFTYLPKPHYNGFTKWNKLIKKIISI